MKTKGFSAVVNYAAGLLLALGLAPLGVQAASYCTDAPVDGAIYKIVNVGSEKILSVDSASTSSGANVSTTSNTGSSSQRFYLYYQSSSHYWQIKAAHSGMLVDVASASISNGGNIIQASTSGATSQEWEPKQQSDGSYKIVNRNSSLSMTVASAAEGANVYQNADAGLSSQRWWLEPVNVTCGSASSITLGGSASSGQVALSWTTPPSGTSALQVYYDTDSNPSGRSRLAILSTTATSYTATGLTNGTPYWFWIKYLTADGTWLNSNAFNATPSSSSSSSSVTGFASISGSDGLSTTTGGAGGSTVTVTSCSALKTALASSSAMTIQIPDNTTIDCKTSSTAVSACKLACPDYQDAGKYTYRIPTSTITCSSLGAVGTATVYKYDQKLPVASNKTLIGLGSNSVLKGGSLVIDSVKNVIVKNLTITDINPHLIEADDGITINNASHVLVDHVGFSLISDGHVDINTSKNITLSYNHFDGYNTYVCANQHWYTNAVVDSQVTFHHNFWDYAAGRNPKLTGSATRAHIYNNYWLGITYFSVGVSDSAQALMQANYFNNSARPHWNEGAGLINANVSTNVYTGISNSGTYAVKDTGASVFGDVSMYNYSTDSASALSALQSITGAQ